MTVSHSTALRRILGSLLVVATCCAAGAPCARADGDPASDVLAAAPLFLSGDAGFSGGQELKLSAAIARVRASGLPVRVAVIASPADLGSVTELWRMPAGYARFLGQELSLVYRGTLLVVMPDGFGLARISPSGVVAETPPAPRRGAGLATASLDELAAIAATQGHRLSLTGLPRGAAHGGSSSLGSIDAGSIAGLVLGAAAIAAAWTMSLRARPLRGGPGRRVAR